MELPSHVVKNQAYWDRTSDDYQRMHAEQLGTSVAGWGVWGISEDELHVLGDVAGKDILEFGCGGAQWSIFLAKQGARPVGLDISGTQLSHARELMAKAGVSFPLIHASAESVPLPNASFDIIFCDHGATTFADPRRTVPEAARLLRQGGAFAFNMSSPLRDACWNATADRIESSLQRDYFSMYGDEDADSVVFQLPYGAWIQLFHDHGFAVEGLVELRPPPDAHTTYPDFVPLAWARRWPAENIWKLRKVR